MPATNTNTEWTLTRTNSSWIKDKSSLKCGYWAKAFWYCECGTQYFYADTKKEALAKIRELRLGA